MKIKGLRRKISFVVIVPLLIGILLTNIASVLPLYLYYPKILDTYTDKMIDNQRETMLKESSLISNVTGVGYMQTILNGVNIVSDVAEEYLFYGMNTKNNLNNTAIYQYSYDFNEERVLSNTKSKPFYNISVWYIPENATSPSAKTNLENSAIFNTIIKAFVTNGKLIENTFCSSYLAYQNNGFFYRYPGLYMNYSEKGCVSNQKSDYGGPVYSKNCDGIKNCTNCTFCKASYYTFDPYYDPRCRSFYNYTYTQKINQALITAPYIFESAATRGQSACRGQWNFTTTQLVLVYCVDYLLNDILLTDMIGLSNNDNKYAFILDSYGNVIDYRNNKTLSPYDDDILALEFKNNTSERNYFNETILPLFENQRTEVKDYTKDGEKMMIAVTPIMMITSSDSTKLQHMASVGVVMKKSSLESKFDILRHRLNSVLLINIYLSAGLLAIIAVMSVIWTYKITGSIVSPIDHLLTILKRMKNHDLDIDILESYEPSPPEVASLYKVFDELRVVMRFSDLENIEMTKATLITSQALNLFTKFGNKKGMKVCYRQLGYIFYKRELWEDSAEYLGKALELAEDMDQLDDLTKAKMKAELANAMIKAGVNQKEALALFIKAQEVVSRYNKEEEILSCLLDITEELYEKKYDDYELIKLIEKTMGSLFILDKNIVMQRYYYIKALYYRNLGKDKTACQYFLSALEDFPVYLPSVRTRSIDALNEIFSYNIKEKINLNLTSYKNTIKKDIVLIVCSSLSTGPISNAMCYHLKSILKSHDRISLLQFHSECKVVFNLTKLPKQIFNLQKFETNFDKVLLYDCIVLGIKQLSLNKMFRCEMEIRQEWMIVITDFDDFGSVASFDKVVELVRENGINLVIASLAVGVSRLEELAESVDNGSIFYVKSNEQADLVFREIEAFMCPEKEIYLSSDENM